MLVTCYKKGKDYSVHFQDPNKTVIDKSDKSVTLEVSDDVFKILNGPDWKQEVKDILRIREPTWEEELRWIMYGEH